MQRNITDKILAKFTARRSNVSANIHDHKQITPSLFKVICTVTSKEAEPESLQRAIASAVGNELSVVEGSFRLLNKSGIPAVIGFIKANTVSRDYDAETASSQYREVAKNVLMSKDDESLWDVREVSGTKILVRKAQDDLGQLVQTARVRAFNVPKLSQIEMSSVGNHEYVSYVCAKTNELRSGFVLATSDTEWEVYTDKDETDFIDPETVVESAFVKEGLAIIAAEENWDLPANLEGKEGMKQYYDLLYSYNDQYRSMVDDIVTKHAVA